LEHHEQNAQQDRETSDRMQKHGVEPSRQRIRFRWGSDREPDNAVGFTLSSS
jgi:hypothetical protein